MARLIGGYELLSKLGAGSYADVFLAVQKSSGNRFAIKRISKDKISDPKLQENLDREILIMRDCDHPNILRLYERFHSEKYIFMVLELCAGGDLSKYIKTCKRLDERVARKFIYQISSGLSFLAAKKLIHRDLKPANVLLTETSENATLKIADFGFAKPLGEAALAQTPCGTPLYMAPEVLEMQEYDAKADVWSVGCIYYEMLVGFPPFRGTNQRDLLNNIKTKALVVPNDIHVSDESIMVLRRLLEPVPKRRASLEQFHTACGVLIGKREGVASKVGSSQTLNSNSNGNSSTANISNINNNSTAMSEAAHTDRESIPARSEQPESQSERRPNTGVMTPPAHSNSNNYMSNNINSNNINSNNNHSGNNNNSNNKPGLMQYYQQSPQNSPMQMQTPQTPQTPQSIIDNIPKPQTPITLSSSPATTTATLMLGSIPNSANNQSMSAQKINNNSNNNNYNNNNNISSNNINNATNDRHIPNLLPPRYPLSGPSVDSGRTRRYSADGINVGSISAANGVSGVGGVSGVSGGRSSSNTNYNTNNKAIDSIDNNYNSYSSNNNNNNNKVVSKDRSLDNIVDDFVIVDHVFDVNQHSRLNQLTNNLSIEANNDLESSKILSMLQNSRYVSSLIRGLTVVADTFIKELFKERTTTSKRRSSFTVRVDEDMNSRNIRSIDIAESQQAWTNCASACSLYLHGLAILQDSIRRTCSGHNFVNTTNKLMNDKLKEALLIQYDQLVVRAEQSHKHLSTLSNANDDSTQSSKIALDKIPSPEPLMYSIAMKRAREASVEELLGKLKKAIDLYSSSKMLIEIILLSSTDPNDRKILINFAQVFESLIEKCQKANTTLFNETA